MTSVSYAICGGFYLLHRNISLTTRLWVRSVPVSIELAAEVSHAEALALSEKARVLGASASHLVTPEEGRKRIEASLGGSRLMAGFDTNPLPPVLELTFDTPPSNQVLATLRALPAVVDVDDAVRWSARFQSFLTAFDRIAGALGTLLLFAVFTMAALGARLVAANHARESEIQRLVGAPESFVLTPYLLSCALMGLFGAGAALLALGALFQAAASVPVEGWPIPIHNPVFFSLRETAMILTGASGVGAFGAYVGLKSKGGL